MSKTLNEGLKLLLHDKQNEKNQYSLAMCIWYNLPLRDTSFVHPRG